MMRLQDSTNIGLFSWTVVFDLTVFAFLGSTHFSITPALFEHLVHQMDFVHPLLSPSISRP
jgi:hypothetical protein